MRNLSISKLIIKIMFFFVIILLLFVSYVEIREHKFQEGYAAFNTAEYDNAHENLKLIAILGDSNAQQLLSYMYGLGLGRSIDFGEAIYWMKRRDKNSSMEQAYYLGLAASDGQYGEKKKDLGDVWLKIACFSLPSPNEKKKNHSNVTFERCSLRSSD